MITTVLLFILVLSVLVFVHEFGHFIVAKKIGAKVEEFGFGFPPKIWGIKKGETEYTINWIPIGGFVKIKGEGGEEKHDRDSFASKKAWQKFLVLAAGVTMNFVLAGVLFSGGLMIGLPGAVDGEMPSYAKISDEKIQIMSVLEQGAAQAAGVQMGDVIISLDGVAFETVAEIQDYTAMRDGEEVTLELGRGQEVITVKVTPAYIEDIGKVGFGVGLVNSAKIAYPWYIAIWKGFEIAALMTAAICVAFYEIIKNLLMTGRAGVEISGPVGIAVMTGQVAQMGWIYLLNFTAVLSLNLAIINLLPFPALDGGRILFLAIEKLRRRDISDKVQAVVHNLGFIFLMILVVLVTYRDLVRFGGQIWGSVRGATGL